MLIDINPPEMAKIPQRWGERIGMKSDIASRLGRGSENIDQMRKHLEVALEMIVRFAQEDIVGCSRLKPEETAESASCLWKITRYDPWPNHTVLTVICIHKKSNYCVTYSHTVKLVGMGAEILGPVYDDFQTFVDKCYELFPELKGKLAPFLDASDRF